MSISVPLTRGLAAMVDRADYERVVSVGKWHAGQARSGRYYARRRVRTGPNSTRIESLHTFLTGWPLVDHINGDALDNRRSNLRPATAQENAFNRGPNSNNTSGFKGVCWVSSRGRWLARIKADGRTRHLGYHATAMSAAVAYDRAARLLHGEFAWLNFPEVGT